MNIWYKQGVYLVIISVFVPLLLINSGYSGDIHKWKDKDGNVYISDTPKLPQQDSEKRLQKRGSKTTHDISQNVNNNPISEVSIERARQDLKRELRDRYGSSYSTIEMLFKSNMEDYYKLCDVPSTSVNNNILQNLKDRYYPNFSTILQLFKSNKESYENLQ